MHQVHKCPIVSHVLEPIVQQAWCKVHVAVPGRNWTLFHCVFQSHFRIQSAVTQYLRCRWGSYALWILDTFTQRVWAPLPTEVLRYSTLNAAITTAAIMSENCSSFVQKGSQLRPCCEKSIWTGALFHQWCHVKRLKFSYTLEYYWKYGL